MAKYRLTTLIGFLTIFSAFSQVKIEDKFKLNTSENKAVLTCSNVINDKSSILFVERYSEGDWQFLCGKEDHLTEDAEMIFLKQALQLDKTLKEVLEIPNCAGATRKYVDGKWYPFKA